jgi:hypothetical protein
MASETSLISLFTRYQLEYADTAYIELQNKKHEPIGVIYLDKVKFEQIHILAAEAIDEKYLIYINGIAIFFTYYRLDNTKK